MGLERPAPLETPPGGEYPPDRLRWQRPNAVEELNSAAYLWRVQESRWTGAWHQMCWNIAHLVYGAVLGAFYRLR